MTAPFPSDNVGHEKNKIRIDTSLRQFINNGLAGVAVVLFVFLLLSPVITSFFEVSSFFDYIGLMFSSQDSIASPMPLIPLMMLNVFLSVGVSGRFLEKATSRSEWGKPVTRIAEISLLIEVILYAVPRTVAEVIGGDFRSSDIIYGTMSIGIVAFTGALIRSVVAGSVGLAFNPNRRVLRIVIGTIPGIVIGYELVFVTLLARALI